MKRLCANCGRPLIRVQSNALSGWYWMHDYGDGGDSVCHLVASPTRTYLEPALEAALTAYRTERGGPEAGERLLDVLDRAERRRLRLPK